MTREEFQNTVCDAESFFEFCTENGYENWLEDKFLAGELDSKVYDDIEELRRNKMWYEMRDRLNDVSDGYDMYRWDGELDYMGYDAEEIDDLIGNLEDALRNDGFFEDDWEDEDDDDDDGDDDGDWDYACTPPVAAEPVEQEPSEPTQNVQVLLF